MGNNLTRVEYASLRIRELQAEIHDTQQYLASLRQLMAEAAAEGRQTSTAMYEGMIRDTTRVLEMFEASLREVRANFKAMTGQ